MTENDKQTTATSAVNKKPRQTVSMHYLEKSRASAERWRRKYEEEAKAHTMTKAALSFQETKRTATMTGTIRELRETIEQQDFEIDELKKELANTRSELTKAQGKIVKLAETIKQLRK